MTVLEWLRAKTRYSFSTDNFVVIATDRNISPETDIVEVSRRDKELMEADIIYTAVLLSPSNTASLQQSHNGYQKTIGQEQDFYQDEKIKYAIRIYKKYDDDKALDLEDYIADKRIKFIPIVDVDRL